VAELGQDDDGSHAAQNVYPGLHCVGADVAQEPQRKQSIGSSSSRAMPPADTTVPSTRGGQSIRNSSYRADNDGSVQFRSRLRSDVHRGLAKRRHGCRIVDPDGLGDRRVAVAVGGIRWQGARRKGASGDIPAVRPHSRPGPGDERRVLQRDRPCSRARSAARMGELPRKDTRLSRRGRRE